MNGQRFNASTLIGTNFKVESLEVRNFRSVQTTSASWTLMGLTLVACGGGGGGDQLAITRAGQSREETLPDGTRAYYLGETNNKWEFEDVNDLSSAQYVMPQLPPSIVLNDEVPEVAFVNPRMIRYTFDIQGDDDLVYEYVIDGTDVGSFEFFDDGFGVYIRTTGAVDYDVPTDSGEDNVYEITRTLSTTDTRIQSDLRQIESTFRFQVLDVEGDETLPTGLTAGQIVEQILPIVNSDAGVFGIGVLHIGETNGTVNFALSKALNPNDLGESIDINSLGIDAADSNNRTISYNVHANEHGLDDFPFTVTISGTDADSFQFAVVEEGIQIQTLHVLDYENPQDDDDDNIYELEFIIATEDERIPVAAQSETIHIEVRVHDVPNDGSLPASEGFSDSSNFDLETQTADIL